MASYADDIIRIAKQKRIKGGLGTLGNRDPIPGTVTPFIDSALSTPSDGASPQDKVPEATDPNNPNTFNKGDGSGGTSGGGAGSNKNGPQTADDLLDDKAGPTVQDSNATAPSDGGSLNKITGLVDCNTGQGVNVHLDGQFNAPAGWYAPDSPPVTDGWVSGVRWWNNLEQTRFAIPIDSANAVMDIIIGSSDPTTYIFVSFVEVTPGVTYLYTYIRDGSTFSFPVSGESCTPSLSSPSCPITPPTDTEWPTDGNYDLAFQDGQFKTSQYDSEAPSSYNTNQTSAVNLCTTNGRHVMIRAASNGGTMMYETSGSAPTGTVKVYNSDGTMRMAGDATQTNINGQLPR